MANGTEVKVDPKVEAPVVDQKKVDAALADAHAADMAVIAAQAKVDEANKSPEQKALDKAMADASSKRAKAMELAAASKPAGPMSVEAAKVMAPVPGDMPAGDHKAQKFGNDPANPAPGPTVPVGAGSELMTVKLSRKSPDHPELIETMVHPDMVGDYLRAGWNLA